ncbi:efflux RND transporter permease subunit [soil metagenome]
MLTAVVRWSLARPRLIAAGALVLLIYGGFVLLHAKFDVFPDFVPAQTEVQTEAPGLAAEQVEELFTRPVEHAVDGAAGVTAVRSDSIQGLSVVTVVFGEGADPFRARQIVSESLGAVAATLPAGVKAPLVTPLTSSTMDLLKVGFTSDTLSPMALRALVDTVVRPRILSAAGVARATVSGGEIGRIEVRVRPDALAAKGLSFTDVVDAVRRSTGISGGGFIDTPQQRILIEPRGQASKASDISAARVGPGLAGIRLSDVAEVVDAPAPDVGEALILGKPGVLLSISSQYGANTLDATKAVEKALAELAPSFNAQGVTVNAGLHRPANFIEVALTGISEDLLIGAGLIAVVLFLFMRNFRAVMVSFVSIPLSLLAAIAVMHGLGWTINIMTLGGLAVALGVVVDDAVIDVENIIRRLRAGGGDPAETIVLNASLEVRAPVIYATLVVALVLAPVLLLHGLQGAFFAPLAAAFVIATLASLVVAVVVTPPLTLLLLRNARLADEPGILARAKTWHAAVLRRVCTMPSVAVGVSVLGAAGAVAGFFLFNSELLPAFRESHFALAVAGPPGTSLAVMRDYGKGITRDLLAIPGILDVEQQIGRAPGGEDTWGPERSEFHVELKRGLKGADQDRIEDAIHKVLDGYPGLETEVLTFLTDRIGESLTGETAALAVGVYGENLDELDEVAGQIAAVMEKVPGAEDVTAQTPPETPVVRIDLDFARLARFGFSAGDVLDTIQTAYEGAAAAQIYQSARTIDIAVTTTSSLRQDPETVGDLLLRSPEGALVSLRQVAKVYLTEGRTVISHEGGRRRQVVTANPKPAEARAVTVAVQTAIATKVKLPAGVYVDYSGTAEATQTAQRELLFNTAMAGGAVVALLLIAFGSGRSTGLILGAAPFAMAGCAAAVALTGGNLSLGSLVGFVTLFGVAARNAILLISHTEHLAVTEGHGWSLDTVIQATRERVTPILMTALVTALGLLPLALQTGQAGREIQGPMAIVILGGLLSSTIMSLVLLPAMIWRFGRPKVFDPPRPV